MIIKLESNNKTLILGTELYKILNIEGIESSEYETNIEIYNNYDGGYIHNQRIKPRSISVAADFLGENTEEERRKLISFFNPKHNGKLLVNYCGVERGIHYIVESFRDKRDNLYDVLSFQFDLICPNPFFHTVYQDFASLDTWVGGLQLKFTLPFRFKQKGDTKQNIYYTGDVNTPVEIFFKGPALNPKIANETTGEFIRINKKLETNDILYINTAYKNKQVKIITDNQSTNAFHYIDLDSTFFELQQGDNLISYSSEDAEQTPRGVDIKYYNRFLGI